jgi:hypothetical protein
MLLATVALADRTQLPWSCHVIDASSRGADGVKLADVNADGLLDIATGWEEGGTTRVYINPGPSSARQTWPAVTVGRTPSVEDAVWADLDGDGATDVVTSCEGATRTMFVHWAPAPTEILSAAGWLQEEIPAAQDRMQWMFAQPADIDGREGVELVAAGKGGGAQLGWLGSRGERRHLDSWLWHPVSPVGWVMSILPSDMDSDGDIDLLITDRRGDRRGCRWLENPGPGVRRARFWADHVIGGSGREVMFATTADLDQDGLSDVLVAAKPAVVLCLRRLDATGRSWAESTIAFPDNMGTAKGIAVGDIDGDGRPDIVLSCEAAAPPKSGLRWLSYGQSPFGTQWHGHEISGPDGTKFDRIELLDLDGDADLDVLTCEERHANRGLGVVWYENPFDVAQR